MTEENKETIRAFFAIKIPTTMQDTISKISSHLKKEAHLSQIKWVKPENLHLTLRFLKSITKEQCIKISQDVAIKLKSMAPFTIEFSDLILFPNAEFPIALVLKPSPITQLLALSLTIDECVIQNEVSKEKRPFNPHLTLAKIRNRLPSRTIAEILKKTVISNLALEVDSVTLIKSQPTAQGSNYTKIASFSLGDPDKFQKHA